MAALIAPTSTLATAASDAALLGVYRRTRDDLAFGRLVARHAEALRTVAYRNTGNAAAAEDVMQASFLVLTGRLRAAQLSARRHGSLRPWLMKVCRYCAANWRRSEARRKKREHAAAVTERVGVGVGVGVGVDPSGVGELHEQVVDALAALRHRERRLIELHHLEGHSWPDVAERMKLDTDTARRAGNRAIERLRAVLERRGITTATGVLAAALSALAKPARHAPALPSSAAFQISRGTLIMLKLNTFAVGLVATGLVGILGLGSANLLQATTTTTPNTTTTITAPGGGAQDRAMVLDAVAEVQLGQGGERIFKVDITTGDRMLGGIAENDFLAIHGLPPATVLAEAVEFNETPLSEVVEHLREASGRSIDYHMTALAMEGIASDTPVTFSAKAGTRLTDVMNRILATLSNGISELRFAWRYNTYVLTTRGGLEVMDAAVVDQVGELLLGIEGEGEPEGD